MNNEQLKTYVYRKLECSINVSLSNGIPLTRSTARRASPERKGQFYIYNYVRDARRNIVYIFALDTILINRKTTTGYHSEDIAKALCLQPQVGKSLEYGFTGANFNDCELRSELSRIMYDVGISLKKRFHDNLR